MAMAKPQSDDCLVGRPSEMVSRKRDRSALHAGQDTLNDINDSDSEVEVEVKEKEKNQNGKAEQSTFRDLGVHEEICKACMDLGWKAPTDIQREAIPYGIQGRDLIGLAETGSGKTGAFSIPLLQKLLENPGPLFGCILAPTRELAFQIHEVIGALGSRIGVKSCCIVGGVDMMSQAISLARKPHVIVATPGRLVDHLENTKGFHLRTVRVLVLDEADKMLSMDFEEELNSILEVIPKQRQTFLFSATMTRKVAKLQRASLVKPAKVEVNQEMKTVKTLVQQYLFLPAKYKEVYLVYTLNEFSGQTTLIFVSTCNTAERLAVMLRVLGLEANCLHGQMAQTKRLGALNKFKAHRKILIATDVASRGLDIPEVDLIINYDVPSNGKDYIHRVGRTARAGKSGRAITMVTQYEIELYQRIEQLIGQALDQFDAPKDAVMVLHQRVSEAQHGAMNQIKEKQLKYGDKKGVKMHKRRKFRT